MAKAGRAKGSRNRGFFYRKGRGWVATEGNRTVPLEHEDGTRLHERNMRVADVKAAHDRYLEQQKIIEEAEQQAVQLEESEEVRWERLTIADVSRLYLDYCQANDSESTYRIRADALFDFCTGFPAGLRGKSERPARRRIHDGFGELLVSQLIPLHVDQWLAKHPRWKGCRRSKVKALLRTFNYCVDAGVLPKNPIKGFKPGKDNIRRVYFTPAQEAAMYEVSSEAIAVAIQVCIRTGSRPGCEFASVTAEHVHEHEKGIEWRFSANESKTNKPRIIRITDENIIAIVRKQIKK